MGYLDVGLDRIALGAGIGTAGGLHFGLSDLCAVALVCALVTRSDPLLDFVF